VNNELCGEPTYRLIQNLNLTS